MLHLIFQSPLENATLQRITEGDAVVFLESAVLWLLHGSIYANELKALMQISRVFVLQADLEMRGIAPETMLAGIQVIDYPGLVTLTTEYLSIQSWL